MGSAKQKKSNVTELGFSLIEVLIAISLMGITTLGFITMMDYQHKDMRVISEKLATFDLHKAMLSTMTNSICDFVLLDPTQSEVAVPPNRSKSVFDSTNPADAITLQKIPSQASVLGIAHPVAVAAVASSVSAMASNVVVSAIQIFNFTNVAPDLYQAELQINFDPTKMSKALRPLSLNIWLTTDSLSPANAKVSRGCSLAPPMTSNSDIKGFCTPNVSFDNTDTTVTCSPIAGYTFRRYAGDYLPASARQVQCCYIPNTSGSPGWCSGGMSGWNGSFVGCGPNTPNYEVVHVWAVKAGLSDEHECCFIPTTARVGTKDIFSTRAMRADDGWSTCSGPFAHYDSIFQNAVTGAVGRMISCTFYSK